MPIPARATPPEDAARPAARGAAGIADGTPVRTVSLEELNLAGGAPAAAPGRPPGSVLTCESRSIYALLSTIDQGGMGRVYLARDERLSRSVAIKVMLQDSGRRSPAVRRFVEEAQITSQLEHPNIVPLHELGVDQDGRLFFAMKLVRGETLAARLARWRHQQLTPALLYEALTIILKVLDALSFAHSRGVVHRDVKPANIMIGAYGEVLLMDWGIARVLAKSARDASDPRQRAPERAADRVRPGAGRSSGVARAAQPARDPGPEPADAALTCDGDIVGTPGYMAPEQARGDLARIDHRADIYAIGAILYELLAGACPYQGTLTEMLAKAASGVVPAPSRRARARQVPPELDAVTMKAMAPLPQARYRSAKALAEDVTSYLAGRSVSVRPDRPLEALRKFASRNLPLAVTIVAAIAVLAVVSTLFIGHILHQQRKNEQLAQEETRADAAAQEAEASRIRASAAEQDRKELRMRAFVPYAGAIDLLGRDGFLDESITLLRQATATDGEFAEAHFALGRALVAAGDPADAIPEFRCADALSVKLLGHHNPRAVLAAALAEDDCGTLTHDAYGALAALGPDDPYALLGRAFSAAMSDDVQDMLDAGSAALRADPRLWEAHYADGYAILHGVIDGLLKRAQLAQAKAQLRSACAMEPHALQPRLWLALAEQLDEEPVAQWEHELDTAIALQPSNPVPLLCAVGRYLDDGQMTAAREALDRAERLSPTGAYWLAVRSQYAMRTGHPDEALELSAQAARVEPIVLLTGGWLNLAAGLGKSGELGPEIERFRVEARGTAMLAALEWHLASARGEDATALALADVSLAKAPFNDQMLCLRAQSLIRLGRLDDALAASQAAMAQAPLSASAVMLASHLLEALHRGDQAGALLASYAARHPRAAHEYLQYDAPAPGAPPRAPSPQGDQLHSLFGNAAP